MTTTQISRVHGEMREAADRLLAEVFEGIRHGFFQIVIEGEIAKGGKRGLTIRAGKSYRYMVHPDQLQ